MINRISMLDVNNTISAKKDSVKLFNNAYINNVNHKHLDAALLRSYFIKSPCFCGVKTNYHIFSQIEKKLVPLELNPKMNFADLGIEDNVIIKLEAHMPNLREANLDKMYLKGAKMPKSNMQSVSLKKTRLSESDMQGSDFKLAYCPEIRLNNSNFSDCDFSEANMEKANLQNTNMQNSKFNYTILRESNIIGTDFSGAEGLNPNLFRNAVYDNTTKFPENFKPTFFMRKFESGANLEKAYLKNLRIKTKNELDFDNYQKIIFKNTYLKDSQFIQLDMQNCDFKEANCEKILFRNCILGGSDFRDTNLERANFQGSTFHKAIFAGDKTSLQKANLVNCDLRETDLNKLEKSVLQDALYSSDTKFPIDFEPLKSKMKFVGVGSDLSEMSLSGTSFKEIEFSKVGVTDLRKSKFKKSDLSLSYLEGVNLQNSIFDKAYLKGAHFKQANCEEVSFKDTKMYDIDLTETNMKKTDLCGSKLKGAIIQNTDFEGAKYDVNTEFPEGFDPQANKMILVEAKKIKVE